MKPISSHLALPLALGLSLTGVCVGLFYFLYKKKDEEENRNPISLKEVKNITYEIKILRQFVPGVIGRAGVTIKDIEERTSTRIRFNKDDSELSERICQIRGTVEAIKLAEAMIQNLIANMPIIETYEMFISQPTASKLLEKKGSLINNIQSITNTKIILEKKYNDFTEPRRVIIKGTAEHIAEAVSAIEDLDRETKSTIERLKLARSSRSPRNRNPSRDTVNVKTPENSPQQLESSTVVQEGVMEVYVSAVESPSRFWVQVVGEGTTLALDLLVQKMTAYYNNEDNNEIHILRNISVGQMVAAKFSYDSFWYRAEVVTLMDNGLYEVYFVDYGDHELVDAKSILELRTDFLSLRLQAIECCLANVKPKDDEWSKEACDRFDVLTWAAQWKILTAKVSGYKERVLGQGKSRREGSPIPCMELFDKNDNLEINIGKQLIVDTFAIAEGGTWSATSSTLSLSKQNDFSTSTTVAHDSTSVSSISSAEVSPQQDKQPSNELIDLTTPIKTQKSKVIEEIDLVTPRHEQIAKFINAEKESDSHENNNKIPGFDPSTIDSNDEADSDEFELG